MTSFNNQSQIEAIRTAAKRKALEDINSRGIRIDSPEAVQMMSAAVDAAETSTWNQVYQKSLENLFNKKNPSVRFIENDHDAQALGGKFQPADDDVDAFARLQADQFIKGMKPIKYDEWLKQDDRGGAFATAQSVVGNLAVGLEGLAGFLYSRGWGLWDTYGYGGMMWDSSDDPNRKERHFGDMKAMSDAAKVAVRSGLQTVSPGMFGFVTAAVGGDPTAPVMASERYGSPEMFGSRALGETVVDEAGNIGQALASQPLSIPSMMAPNLVTRAIAMAPFAVMGWGDARQARWDLYKEQVRMAEDLGISPPPMPSLAELETLGLIGAFFEVGSEFVGDGLQAGGMKIAVGKVAGKGLLPEKLAIGLSELSQSMARSRGFIGRMKQAAYATIPTGLMEGVEEVVPHLGEQVQDLAGDLLFKPDNDFWAIDRPFFDAEAGPENLWINEDVRHSFKVGAYAGGLMGGAHYYASPTAIKQRREARAVEQEVKKGGTQFVTEALMNRQRQDALVRFRRNAVSARGSAMAMHQVEQMGNGTRGAMFIDPADLSDTLTKDVRDRMIALKISPRRIGTVDGKYVYAATANVQSVRDAINDGRINEVVGSPLVNDGQVMMGAVVMRDNAGRIVEVMPYSDPVNLHQSRFALVEFASRNGLTVDVVNHTTPTKLSDINEQLNRQIDADAVSRGKPTREQRPARRGDVSRGIRALRMDIGFTANGTKAQRNSKGDAPFESKYLSKEEVGDAKNDDVTVTVTLDRVNEDALSEGESNLARMNAKATILDGKVVFSIKQADGSVKQIEKPILADGVYLGQVSPDGVYLIRENGTAMTARTATALGIHEVRHRTLSRSPAGAEYMAKLLQLDPVYAMRGGANYMRNFADHSKRSDAQIIAYYRGVSEAVNAVLAGNATAEQQKTIAETAYDEKGRPTGDIGTASQAVQTFAEESVTTTANRTVGQLAAAAIEWNAAHKNAQERSMRSFANWFAAVLVDSGIAGPEAKQIVFEASQRMQGISERELQIHRKYSDQVRDAFMADLDKAQKQARARALLRNSPQQAGAAPAPAPSAAPSTAASPSAAPAIGAVGAAGVGQAAASALGGGGDGEDDDKKKIEDAISALQSAQQASPEQRGSIISKVAGVLSEVVPMLSMTSAQIAPSTKALTPQRQNPSTRPIPSEMRDVRTPPAQTPVTTQPVEPSPLAESAMLEQSARRQREAADAMAIIGGDKPSAPVSLGTVARIERARTFMQNPEEEIRMSVRERPGRREQNDEIRNIRNDYMQSRGIEPEQRIEDTYAEVDQDFAKKVADWFESTPVNYEDPKMLSAYKKFSDETLDQYNYLTEKGYEIIPWAGEGQPYADSADMLEDVRDNKRLFFFKTVNPDEALSFGSDPKALDEAIRKNPLLADTGIEVADSNGNPYRMTYNDLFRGVHDIMGHAGEGFQFGQRGEENAYRSHAVMYSPEARQAMATETRGQNSWVNAGPNRRNADGSVWGQEDPRYKPWLENLKKGIGYADQKPMLMPAELTAMYSMRNDAQNPNNVQEPFYHAVISDGIGSSARIVGHTGRFGTFDEARNAAEAYKKGARDPMVDVFRVENGNGVLVEGQRDAQPAKGERPVAWESLAGDARFSQRQKKTAAANVKTQAVSQRTPESSALATQAAQRREQSAIARSNAKGKPAIAETTKISISAEPTARPFVSEHVIVPAMNRYKSFSRDKAYERVHGRAIALLNNAKFIAQVNNLVSMIAPNANFTLEEASINEVRGNFAGRNERAMRIMVNGLTHEQNVSLAHLLGSLMLQEAVIVTSPVTSETPVAEQADAVMLFSDSEDPLDAKKLETILSDAGNALNGATTHESGRGVWAVWTPYEGNPLTKDEFFRRAKAVADTHGLSIDTSKIRSTYQTIGDQDVLGRIRQDLQGTGASTVAETVVADWDSWVKPAATVVEGIRDEGFDIDIQGWADKVAGSEGKAVASAIVRELAARAAQRRHGLDPRFLTRYEGNMQGIEQGAKIPATTTAENAEESFRQVDALLKRHPKPFASEQAYQRFLADLYGDRTIPIIPSHLIERMRDNFAGMKADMRLREDGGRLTQKMIDDAIHGLEMAQRLRALYAAGKVQPKHTVLLAMWGFLSRGVSPYIQESLFLDIVNFKAKNGRTYGDFVEIAVNGAWNPKKHNAEWASFIGEVFDTMKYPRIKSDGTVALNKKGEVIYESESPGSGAKHNANAFGRNFLANIGKTVTIGGTTQTGLLHFHNAIANPNVTGKQVRRTFASIGESLGIDNKVVSFACLVAGKTDISVNDRVRIGDHYNRDGRYPNAYDGFTIGYEVVVEGTVTGYVEMPLNWNPETGTADEFAAAYKTAIEAEYAKTEPMKEPGRQTVAERRAAAIKKYGSMKNAPEFRNDFLSRLIDKGYLDQSKYKVTIAPVKAGGLASMFDGARGIAFYEATERAIDPNAVFSEIVKKRPDLIAYAHHGAEHWLNWTGASGQEASHKTLDGLIEMISRGDDRIEGVWAKEGRYDTFGFNSEYGYVMEDGRLARKYKYEINGNSYMMTPKNFDKFITAVTDFDWAGLNWQKTPKTKKPKFRVTADSTTGSDRQTPWYDDALVGQNGKAKIEEFAKQFGTRMSIRDMSNADALDAFAKAFVASIDKNPIVQASPSFNANSELIREFARHNIAAQNHEQAFELYKRMVEGNYPKPTIPRYTMYFDRNNAINGIVPNDVWWHGGHRQWTKPNYDISPNQFGLHIGNFNQASWFFDRALKEVRWQADAKATPVLFPLYARAFKTIEIPDMGSWEPEKILHGMEQVGIINRDEQRQILGDMYDAIGVTFNEVAWERYMHGGTPLDIIGTPGDAEKMRYANIFLRDWFADRDIDAIRYQNTVEGRSLSPFAAEPSMYGIETDAWRDYNAKLLDSEFRYMEWIDKAPRGQDGTVDKRLVMEKRKEIFGDQSSIIVWNRGQVKSASAEDVGFRTSMSDIRASMRNQPPAVVNMYPEVFVNEIPARMSMRTGIVGVADQATEQFIDQYDVLRRYHADAERDLGMSIPDIANPFLGARTLTGRLGAMQQQATSDYANILRDMHVHGISLEAMDDFLTAQHALNGGNAYIAAHNPAFPDDGTPGSGGTGMTSDEANLIINDAITSGRFGDMNRIAEDWRSMLRAGLIMRRDAGLITQETYDAITNRYTHYVPLRGAPGRPFDELFEDFDTGETFGRGLSTQGRGMPRRFGRRSRAEGVTSQVGFLHEDTFRRVARNEIAQRFLRLALLVNDQGMAEVVRPQVTRDMNGVFRRVPDPNWANDPQHFGVYINQPMTINGVDYEPGDLVVLRLNNPRLVAAINTPNAQLTQFEQGLRHVNNAWRFVTTGMGNPTFAPVNLIRDVGAGSLSNIASHGVRDTAQMLRRYPSAFMHVFRDAWNDPTRPTGAYARFVQAGGDQLYWRANDLETKNTDFQQLAERVARRDPNDRSLARTLLGWYPAFFTAAETATRLAQFQQRMATGSTAEQAALAARDITVDFAKGGKRKAGLNTWYMFLNASLQGSVNVGKAIGRAASLAPSLVLFGAATAMLGRAMGGDDDELGGDRWDNIPDYEKASNIILMDPFGSGKYIKIPLPYGFNTLFSAGVRMADAALGKSTAGDAVAGTITDAMNSFNPFGGSGIKAGTGNLVSALFPTMARPLVEVSLNQNWMGRPIRPESFGKQKKSDAYSYFEGTPEVYVNAAKSLNELGGGDMFESGGVFGSMDMSPNTMQYLVGYYLSGAGRNMDRLVKIATGSDPIEVADIPLARSFAGDSASDTRSLSERYNNIASRTMPDINRLDALRDPTVPAEEKQAIVERGIDKGNIALGRVVEESDKVLRDVRKKMKVATPEQRERLREVRERAMKRVIREGNRLTPD